MAPTRDLSLAAVFRTCSCAGGSELEALRRSLAQNTVAARLVEAVLAQYEGDVRRADRLLRKAWQDARDEERPFVADLWIPILISSQRFDEADETLAQAESHGWATPFAALRCVIAAARGEAARSRQIAAEVEDAVDDEPEQPTRWRVYQRLALAAFYRSEPETALRHVETVIALARAASARRAVAAAASVAYVTHSTLTGDISAALRYAWLMADEAHFAGDRSFRATGLVALYEISVEMADDRVALETAALLRSQPLPEQYRERFASRIADAIVQAQAGDFAAARNVLTVLGDAEDRSAGERALCRALVALFALALGDDDAARKLSRRSIAGTARPPARLPAFELRYRRLARALACAVCALLGDAVRADRRADAALLREDPDIAALASMGANAHVGSVASKVRGYARLIEAVRSRLAARPSTGPLTSTELEILRHIDAGRNAPEIARVLGRSPYTVRTHIRNAVEKLQARGRLDALARARRLGLLTDA